MPSQAIRAFAYDEPRSELTVTFASGRSYVYALVPRDVAGAFAASGSKGRFLNERIRDRYPHRRKTADPTGSPSLRDALAASAEAADGDQVSLRRASGRSAQRNDGSRGRA